MKSFVQNGSTLTYEIPSATTIAAGDVLVIGEFVGIAVNGGTATDKIAVNLEGVYNLTLKSSVDVTQGDKLYWDSTPGEITKTVTDVFIGTAFEDALGAGGEVLVKLAGVKTASAQAANVAAVATADGSDAGTTQTLANALKTKLNDVLVKLKAAGIMVAD